MFNEVIEEINWGGKTLTMKTGKVARQADGAVMISMGETVVLCTTVSAKQAKEGIGFFPLTVHYREMAFAAGKIPGGFFKREGRSSDREVLVCRLIDRPIRPLFHPSFFNETQVICTVLSYDPECNPDILAMIGSSAALAISGVPYMHTIGAARVGHIDGQFVLNPSFDEAKRSRLDLVVAGTDSSVMMVESEADQLSEEEMLSAIEFGHESMRPVIHMIEKLVNKGGKPKWALPTPIISDALVGDISQNYGAKITDAFAIKAKQERVNALNAIHSAIQEGYAGREDITQLQIELALDEVKAKVLRSAVLKSGIRIDGRKTTDIRQIECEASILPKTHGSALFTRGETQGLVVATLGTTQDEQIVDNISGDARDRFMLQYIFPPYSVGEATPLRAPGRREVGHGKLAWRALNPVMPTKDEFPYSLRIVSEITESNGSSSMATVCGSSLAMMDAGVPLKGPVSGIAMGLIKEEENFVILSDILGDEDHLGDMDFKVAGTKDGVTALQMDIKVTGITIEIMKQALSQAHVGRTHILQCMSKTLTSHRTEVNQYAPVIKSFKINKDKIREIIGPGGKVIKDICEKTSAKIDINDDGKVEVSAVGLDNLNAAIGMIMAIAAEPEVGQVFDGTVVKVLESGAFINYMPGRDGFIHISEIADERIDSIDSHLTLDKVVKVKIIGVDPKGKAKLSMRLDATHHSEPPRRERSDVERGGSHKDHKGSRRDDRTQSNDRKRHGMGSTEKKAFN
jgi:polyribonucleotide nucleotidyltransferase